MTIQPPPFGARLLKRLVPARDHEALLGDLQEERQGGRSTAWYVAQIVAAVIVGSWRDIRGHKLVAARAIAVGLVAELVVTMAFLALANLLTGWGFMLNGQWIGLPWYWRWPYSASLEWILFAAAVGGDLIVGWSVVRLNREHGIAMALAWGVAFRALRLAALVQLAMWTGSPVYTRTLLSTAMVAGHVRQLLLMCGGGYLATRQPEIA